MSWAAQLVTAVIFARTLPSKFGGSPDAVALFSTLGVEPFGRLALGTLEALAVLLLLLPRTAALGGLLSVGLLGGAIFAHFTVPGIAIDGDPSLFAMAVVGLATGVLVAWLRRHELPLVGRMFDGCSCASDSPRSAR